MTKKEPFNQFLFGKTITLKEPLTRQEIKQLILKGMKIQQEKKIPTQKQVLSLFSKVAEAWSNPNYPLRKKAFKALVEKSKLDPMLVEQVFKEFPKALAPKKLSMKINGELGSMTIQDSLFLQNETNSRLIVQPAGQVLHIGAGNVFIGCIESLMDGIITKNVNFLKMSDVDRDFPILFAQSIKEFDKEGIIYPKLAILWWQGGDQNIESLFKQYMNRIVFWGGYNALASWKKDLGVLPTIIQHGPKISFGIISKAGLNQAKLPELTSRIALDISVFDQNSCNSPQMLFIEKSIASEKTSNLIASLNESLRIMNTRLPPSKRSDDEFVEILKAREIALTESLINDKTVAVTGSKNLDWTIIHQKKPRTQALEFSPLNRTIIVKPYDSLEDLAVVLRTYSFHLQTIGYCLTVSEMPRYANTLSHLGVTRICPFGKMIFPKPGTPHDGRYSLRDLTRITVVD